MCPKFTCRFDSPRPPSGQFSDRLNSLFSADLGRYELAASDGIQIMVFGHTQPRAITTFAKAWRFGALAIIATFSFASGARCNGKVGPGKVTPKK